MTLLQKFITFYTILHKEVVRFVRIWPQTLLPPVINQTLYFIIFGAFIGSQIGTVQGISYMAFLIPGLMMMGLITNSFINVASSFFSVKFQRNIEEILVAPVSPWAIVCGYTLGGMARGILISGIIFVVSIFFVYQTPVYPFLAIIFIFLTSLVFSLAGLINGILANKFDDISIIPTFILTPLTYFGGVFYSIKNLPPFWQNMSRFNPILYMVDGLRFSFYGLADVNVFFSVAILIVLSLILAFSVMYLLRKGVGLRA